MHVTSDKFSDNARAAIADPQLQTGLFVFGKIFPLLREATVGKLPEFDALRDAAKDIKVHTLNNLGTYLEAFEARVEEAGGRVHWARTAEEANTIVEKLCAEAKAHNIIKSKSMVTEELELNDHLIGKGYNVVETDLGEYIIQLRKEKPFHIVGPALHLTAGQVSDTFYEAHKPLGRTEKVEDKVKLVEEARIVLRERFKQADVGITGANFLVAETGQVAIITNEGNADLTATLPKRHIVVTGIEKIVPTLDDLSVFLRILPRSATGQETSNYVSLYSGPRRARDADGPAQFDIVLVDNGRTDMLGTPVEEMLRCIRCGACLNACPVFTTVGGQSYGSVYSGPMGSVWTPALASVSSAAKLPNASSFCGKCEEVCPVRIPLPSMMRHWREKEFEAHLTPAGQRWGLGIWAWLGRHPSLYRTATNLAGIGLRLMAHTRNGRRMVTKLPFIGSGWTQSRDLAAPPEPSFLSQYREGRRR
ncbi:lactate utilization protein B [Pyruvatibacter mobilis]|uniref:lactate utilization protein B n=1 Tax=Pyruvatibacter mobilis TaxID=1712261 RepID=UPI003BABB684